MTLPVPEKTRLDRWLWATRLFKTRSQATEACRGGKIRIGNEKAKPSRILKVGEIVEAQRDSITKTVRVLGLIDKRVGAKSVPDYLEDLTPPEVYEQQRLTTAQVILKRDRGSGRPTKKERRDMEQLFGEG